MSCPAFGIRSQCWHHFNHLSSKVCNRPAKTTAVSDSLVESHGAIAANRHDFQTLAKSQYHLLTNKQTNKIVKGESTILLSFTSCFLYLSEIKIKKSCISLRWCIESSTKHFSPKFLELDKGKGNFVKLLWWRRK